MRRERRWRAITDPAVTKATASEGAHSWSAKIRLPATAAAHAATISHAAAQVFRQAAANPAKIGPASTPAKPPASTVQAQVEQVRSKLQRHWQLIDDYVPRRDAYRAREHREAAWRRLDGAAQHAAAIEHNLTCGAKCIHRESGRTSNCQSVAPGAPLKQAANRGCANGGGAIANVWTVAVRTYLHDELLTSITREHQRRWNRGSLAILTHVFSFARTQATISTTTPTKAVLHSSRSATAA